jgi:hypothetical protein
MPLGHERFAKAESSILLLRADSCFQRFHTARVRSAYRTDPSRTSASSLIAAVSTGAPLIEMLFRRGDDWNALSVRARGAAVEDVVAVADVTAWYSADLLVVGRKFPLRGYFVGSMGEVEVWPRSPLFFGRRWPKILGPKTFQDVCCRANSSRIAEGLASAASCHEQPCRVDDAIVLRRSGVRLN